MSYILYTDKDETFTADVSVKNASLKNCIVRLVVESKDLNLIFNGKIENDKCFIPIKKLKGVLDENVKGNIFLEIIAEDVYFKPWSSSFIVEECSSVKVNVTEQNNQYKKPIVEVCISNTNPCHSPSLEIFNFCKQFDINSIKTDSFKFLIKEYFRQNSEYKSEIRPILNRVIELLK